MQKAFRGCAKPCFTALELRRASKTSAISAHLLHFSMCWRVGVSGARKEWFLTMISFISKVSTSASKPANGLDGTWWRKACMRGRKALIKHATPRRVIRLCHVGMLPPRPRPWHRSAPKSNSSAKLRSRQQRRSTKRAVAGLSCHYKWQASSLDVHGRRPGPKIEAGTPHGWRSWHVHVVHAGHNRCTREPLQPRGQGSGHLRTTAARPRTW